MGIGCRTVIRVAGSVLGNAAQRADSRGGVAEAAVGGHAPLVPREPSFKAAPPFFTVFFAAGKGPKRPFFALFFALLLLCFALFFCPLACPPEKERTAVVFSRFFLAFSSPPNKKIYFLGFHLFFRISRCCTRHACVFVGFGLR